MVENRVRVIHELAAEPHSMAKPVDAGYEVFHVDVACVSITLAEDIGDGVCMGQSWHRLIPRQELQPRETCRDHITTSQRAGRNTIL